MQLYFQAFSTLVPKNGERPILTPDPWPGFSIGLSNCRPTSTGSIHIRSSNPLEHPRIVPNAFSTDHDVAEMLDAVKFLRKIAATPTMSKLIVEELLPGAACRRDDELITDFRRRSGTVYHPVSTCRMGPDPAQSVVDPRLRVHGVEGLRIIDCSVFPNIISGNTNAAAMMVGAKGAELVLEDSDKYCMARSKPLLTPATIYRSNDSHSKNRCRGAVAGIRSGYSGPRNLNDRTYTVVWLALSLNPDLPQTRLNVASVNAVCKAAVSEKHRRKT